METYDVACHALYDAGRIRRDAPKDLRELNSFLKRWTTARVHRHYESDGGQLYWHDEPVMFYQETVEFVHRADERTFGEWIEDYCEREAQALR